MSRFCRAISPEEQDALEDDWSTAGERLEGSMGEGGWFGCGAPSNDTCERWVVWADLGEPAEAAGDECFVSGNDLLRGGFGGDRLWGGPGDDELNGMDGDDRLGGGAAADRLLGSRGKDPRTAAVAVTCSVPSTALATRSTVAGVSTPVAGTVASTGCGAWSAGGRRPTRDAVAGRWTALGQTERHCVEEQLLSAFRYPRAIPGGHGPPLR